MDKQLISSATNSLLTASLALRKSYTNNIEDDGIIEIRTNIYNCAMLYRKTIEPFSEFSFRKIKAVCDSIVAYIEKNLLIDKLKNVSTRVKDNVELCSYTSEFYKKILVEFKCIEDEIIRKIGELNLETKAKNEISQLANSEDFNITKIKKIITLLIGSNEDNRIVLIEGTLTILEPLLNSVKNFNTFLSTIAGHISKIHMELKNLKDGIRQAGDDDDDGSFIIIERNAKLIQDYCSGYYQVSADYKTNLDCIKEKSPDNYEGWISNMIKENKKFKNFENLLESMGTDLDQICDD